MKNPENDFLMIRFRHIISLFWALTAGVTLAEEQAPNSAQEDLRAIRQMIEQQALKIETISKEIGKLSQQLESNHGTAPVQPSPVPSEAPVAKPVEPKPVAEPPKAEPVTPLGTTHVVAKGETLTSIAKHYKTSVFDLLKANKIEDDRKLQIGQSLVIPKVPAPHNTPID